MGCGASSTAAEDRYLMGSGPEPTVDRAQGEPPHMLDIDDGIADGLVGLDPDHDPLHDPYLADAPSIGSQWDQLAPMLPKTALHQVAAASGSADAAVWTASTPAAVLVVRLPGFTKMCDDWTGGLRTQPLSRLLNSLFAKLVERARSVGAKLSRAFTPSAD